MSLTYYKLRPEELRERKKNNGKKQYQKKVVSKGISCSHGLFIISYEADSFLYTFRMYFGWKSI